MRLRAACRVKSKPVRPRKAPALCLRAHPDTHALFLWHKAQALPHSLGVRSVLFLRPFGSFFWVVGSVHTLIKYIQKHSSTAKKAPRIVLLAF